MKYAAPTSIEDGAEEILPLYDARDLTKGGVLAQIKLDQAIYTLRITRQGKLILTK
ncbi:MULTISPECIES: hemin uptake protein HemP [unclassified Meridianimarinicoccus]|uniref:hemin uptake protein HemP n=1 Tax=unclassified Meridianimarinicoccus TaxID=2923344 RepID=UPI001868E852|nr:hemin uptake protein HemP [Fluviibacterium sp. MJW13]